MLTAFAVPWIASRGLLLEKLRPIRFPLVLTLFFLGAALCISLMAIFQYFFGFKLLLNYVKEMNINNPFVLPATSFLWWIMMGLLFSKTPEEASKSLP